MKNEIYKIVLSCLILVGFGLNVQAQENINCEIDQPLMQKMCYQKVVSNLGEFIEYPDQAYFDDAEGRVLVRFTTDENKQIQNIQILKSPNQVLAKEVMKAVQLMALEQNNHFMSANKIYRIPVDFDLFQD